MIEQLVIRNFAIIDDLSVTFGPGFNAITGETGAGKSILIDALGAVLGDRVSADLVRTGAERATIDAEFVIDAETWPAIEQVLGATGIEGSRDHLVLTREIQATGRSSARVNGRPVTAGLLSEIGGLLVDIHGQSEHLSLLNRSRQRDMLDAYGVDSSLLTQMSDAVKRWRESRRLLDQVTTHARERAQRIDLLSFQIGEIEGASPITGEDRELEIEYARLSQVERLGSAVGEALGLLDPEDSTSSQGGAGAEAAIRQVARVVGEAVSIDSSLGSVAAKIEEIGYLLDDLLLELRRYASALESNPARLEIVADRLAAIRDLKRKYGVTIEDILAYRDRAAQELETLTGSEFDEEQLRERERIALDEVLDFGRQVTLQRKKAGERLAKDANRAMSDLQLGSASLAVDIRPLGGEFRGSGESREQLGDARFDEHGFDQVELLFSPNTGESARPLARIASGGEMARVMLALKTVLAEADSIPTLVFDEVDVGVGGRSGAMVGEKLKTLSSERQLLVISHLAQVAGFADQHLRISKQVSGERTRSVVELLDDKQRLEEIALMLDGLPITDASRAKAAEMVRRMPKTGQRGD